MEYDDEAYYINQGFENTHDKILKCLRDYADDSPRGTTLSQAQQDYASELIHELISDICEDGIKEAKDRLEECNQDSAVWQTPYQRAKSKIENAKALKAADKALIDYAKGMAGRSFHQNPATLKAIGTL